MQSANHVTFLIDPPLPLALFGQQTNEPYSIVKTRPVIKTAWEELLNEGCLKWKRSWGFN